MCLIQASAGNHIGTQSEEVKVAEPPAHVSYSSLSDWLKCGKYWQLKRLLNLPDRPAVWNIGGHAVHRAIEEWERQQPISSPATSNRN